MGSKSIKTILLITATAGAYLFSNTLKSVQEKEQAVILAPVETTNKTQAPSKKKSTRPKRKNSVGRFFVKTTKLLPDLITKGSLSDSELKVYGKYNDQARKSFKNNKNAYIKTYFKFLKSGKLKSNPSAAYLLGEVILNNSHNLNSIHDRFAKTLTPKNLTAGLLDLVTTSILDTYSNDESLLISKLNALQESAKLYQPEEDFG